MNRRLASRLAIGIWAMELVCFVLDVVVLAINDLDQLRHAGQWGIAAAMFPTVGAVIAARRPEHRLGWVFLVVGLIGPGYFLRHLAQYTSQGLDSPPFSLAILASAGWLGENIGFNLIPTFVLLLFPDGGLPSRRWRPAAWGVGVFVALNLLIGMFAPGRRLTSGPTLINPLGVEALAGFSQLLSTVRPAVLLFIIVISVGALVVRFRRAHGLQRQQIKWFAYVGVLFASWVVLLTAFQFVDPIGVRDESLPYYVLLFVVGPLIYSAFPVAAGIAILRHRLYDIDLLINRTLVYGALTGALALVYWGGVALLQGVLRPLTGGSDLTIVASTLLVAALFQPARHVIQTAVDRRFYRGKYDAERTLVAFSAQVRDEVNLETLTDELLAIARRTMQPASSSLWLRTPTSTPLRYDRGNDSGTLGQ